MYVVLTKEFCTASAQTAANTVSTLEQAFVRICNLCGLSYRFAAEEEGWRLELFDAKQPECKPETIRSSLKRPKDAQHDLMFRAVDGRIRDHIAVRLQDAVRT